MVGPPPSATAPDREDDPTRGHHDRPDVILQTPPVAGDEVWGPEPHPRLPQLDARQSCQRDPQGVAVVGVEDVGSKFQHCAAQAPSRRRVEAEPPRHATDGDALGSHAPRQLAPALRDEELLDVRLPGELPREQADLVLSAAILAAGIDVQDAHRRGRGGRGGGRAQAGCRALWLAAWPSTWRSSASVNGLCR